MFKIIKDQISRNIIDSVYGRMFMLVSSTSGILGYLLHITEILNIYAPFSYAYLLFLIFAFTVSIICILKTLRNLSNLQKEFLELNQFLKSLSEEDIENKVQVSSLHIHYDRYANNQVSFQIGFIVDSYCSKLINTQIINEESSFIVNGQTEDHNIPLPSSIKILKPYAKEVILYTRPIVLNELKKEINIKAKLSLKYYRANSKTYHKTSSSQDYWKIHFVFNEKNQIIGVNVSPNEQTMK